MSLKIPTMHRIFFNRTTQNEQNISIKCNDRFNEFHKICRKWYLCNKGCYDDLIYFFPCFLIL